MILIILKLGRWVCILPLFPPTMLKRALNTAGRLLVCGSSHLKGPNGNLFELRALTAAGSAARVVNHSAPNPCLHREVSSAVLPAESCSKHTKVNQLHFSICYMLTAPVLTGTQSKKVTQLQVLKSYYPFFFKLTQTINCTQLCYARPCFYWLQHKAWDQYWSDMKVSLKRSPG